MVSNDFFCVRNSCKVSKTAYNIRPLSAIQIISTFFKEHMIPMKFPIVFFLFSIKEHGSIISGSVEILTDSSSPKQPAIINTELDEK